MYTCIVVYIYIYIYMHICILVPQLCLRHSSFFSARLPIACITNPWAPVEEMTGPRRVTIKKLKNLGRKCGSRIYIYIYIYIYLSTYIYIYT